jgi:hypothetical protein
VSGSIEKTSSSESRREMARLDAVVALQHQPGDRVRARIERANHAERSNASRHCALL